jgi:hypothetical protein
MNVAMFLGLLNTRHYNGTRNLFTKPKDFGQLPEHFWEDYPPLLAVDTGTPELLRHAERLYEECRSLLPSTAAMPEGLTIEEALARGHIPK